MGNGVHVQVCSTINGKTMKNRNQGILAATGVTLGIAAGNANAALPAEVGGMFTEAAADVTSLSTFVWPVILLGLGIVLAIKYTKRFTSKA